jgi:hypothetical protein
MWPPSLTTAKKATEATLAGRGYFFLFREALTVSVTVVFGGVPEGGHVGPPLHAEKKLPRARGAAREGSAEPDRLTVMPYHPQEEVIGS